MIGYTPHFYVETVPYSGCGQCGIGPGAYHHNTHAVRSFLKLNPMKTIEISISNARSLEHAMEKAFEEAESKCRSTDGKFTQTHKVDKVVFKTLEGTNQYRDGLSFEYKFNAELEEW